MLKVLFFAKLREQLNCAELQVNESVSDIASLQQLIIERLGADKRDALMADNILCSVNYELADRETKLHSGDEVAFYPPVTGG